ncbi:MAG TPA: aldolase/citrate lyase family protein [Armatimonadota bacterium]
MQSLPRLLAEKPALLGTFCTLGSVEAVELACHAGFDFLIIDGQHGAFELGGLREALRAMQAAGCFPIVRLPANGMMLVECLLDMGYPALLAPMVNTPGQAAELATAAHYPPCGLRSQSSCRASLRDAAYRQAFNHDFSLLVMIEHIDAVAAIDDIAALPGVAGCFVGTTDLASSMGDGATREAIDAAVERVRSATLAAGKIAAIAASSIEAAGRYRAQGFGLIVVATDRRLLGTALAQVMTGWQA